MTKQITQEEMLNRVVRFSYYTKEKAVPLMFIDSFIPGQHSLNFAVVGDTTSENPDYEVMLEKWNLISFPPNLWRGFENISSQPAWCFAVLEAHEVFESKDPCWAPSVIRKAREYGFKADEYGKKIRPPNSAHLNAEMLEKMLNA